ncbi:MAG: hypothetical protein JOZ98_15950, partial [Solirubrobacterales bacterium]|nr:hypothetical protein [Solirubrobacterales bacterium]
MWDGGDRFDLELAVDLADQRVHFERDRLVAGEKTTPRRERVAEQIDRVGDEPHPR